MSLKNSKKVETNRYELDITVDAEAFKAANEKAFKQNAKKINIPGFRKGKAPKNIIEKYYGKEVFFEDALNIIYPDAVEEAIKESGLEFVDDKIDFDLVSMDLEKGVEFKVVITVKPEVQIEGYKGLKVEKVIAKVEDSEVEAEVNNMADRNSRLVSVEDRAVENGDITVIDFEGFVDDVAFEGGKAEGYSLTIGSNQFIPGFEEQIIGHNVGEEFDVNVTFPEDYQAEELKGKPAVFKIKLHEIKVKELPAIDDEFAKDVSEFDTLAELKADLKAKALERKQKIADNDVENDLVDQLIDLVKVEIPQAMIEKRVDQNIEDFAYRLQMQGMDMNTYIQYMGGNKEEFRKGFVPQSERQVKVRLALEQIAKNEKLEASAEDIAKEYEKMAEQYNLEVDKIKTYVPESELAKDVVVTKAVDFVRDNAKITEVEKKTEAKEQAKKPAAKKSTAKTAAKKTTTAKKAATAKATKNDNESK